MPKDNCKQNFIRNNTELSFPSRSAFSVKLWDYYVSAEFGLDPKTRKETAANNLLIKIWLMSCAISKLDKNKRDRSFLSSFIEKMPLRKYILISPQSTTSR